MTRVFGARVLWTERRGGDGPPSTIHASLNGSPPRPGRIMGEKFERHRQPWRQDEIQRLHVLAGKGMSVRAIAKALTRSEESVKDRAKADRVKIAKLR